MSDANHPVLQEKPRIHFGLVALIGILAVFWTVFGSIAVGTTVERHVDVHLGMLVGITMLFGIPSLFVYFLTRIEVVQ